MMYGSGRLGRMSSFAEDQSVQVGGVYQHLNSPELGGRGRAVLLTDTRPSSSVILSDGLLAVLAEVVCSILPCFNTRARHHMAGNSSCMGQHLQ